jgi:hypothetical protein
LQGLFANKIFFLTANIILLINDLYTRRIKIEKSGTTRQRCCIYVEHNESQRVYEHKFWLRFIVYRFFLFLFYFQFLDIYVIINLYWYVGLNSFITRKKEKLLLFLRGQLMYRFIIKKIIWFSFLFSFSYVWL